MHGQVVWARAPWYSLLLFHKGVAAGPRAEPLLLLHKGIATRPRAEPIGNRIDNLIYKICVFKCIRVGLDFLGFPINVTLFFYTSGGSVDHLLLALIASY